MKKLIFIVSMTFISLIFIAGCSSKTESKQAVHPDSDGETVAYINGEKITDEDLNFYELINLIQIAMYKEDEKKKRTGKELNNSLDYWSDRETEAKNRNTLLTQAIRLQAMALLAEEKGHTWKQEEIDNEIKKVKIDYARYPVSIQMIKKFGEEQFWEKQKSQYKWIVLAKKVQQDIIDNVKRANPKAESKEINMLAAKKYEELLVSQVVSLKIELLNQGNE